MERQTLYKKFNRLTWEEQLGNLASTLATLSRQATHSKQDKLTQILLREAALMIEWSATNVPDDYHLELAGMQRELLAWEKVFPVENAREILALNTRNQSNKVLQMAQLLDKSWQENTVVS